MRYVQSVGNWSGFSEAITFGDEVGTPHRCTSVAHGIGLGNIGDYSDRSIRYGLATSSKPSRALAL